ncbi:MAG TPA: MFS transporter [Anaeromyxobacteraceae bacterium]|nr:MFS transporter [Anaeromyxobacteraceae bacterium]
MTRSLRPTPPALFLFLDLPFAASVGYVSIAVPFWLREGGLSLAEVGALVATASAPHALKILWIPALDIGSYKRAWYLTMTTATAALLVAASVLPDPVHHLGLYTVLLTLAQATATTGHAANNALMAITTRAEDKGKAGGFSMASNVGGTGLLAAAALVLSEHVSARAAGLLLAAIVVGSAALAWRIDEPRLEPIRFRADPPRWERLPALLQPLAGGATALHALMGRSGAGRYAWALLAHMGAMARDLGRAMVSREGFTGMIICLAPVGCGALTNIFSGMAQDFAASARVVGLVNGLGGGVAGALGALAGGVLADRMNRRLAYAAAGGITALCALAMLASPLTPATYTWGVLAYSFANGIAFATWAGMVLELVGLSPATTTKYALFNAASNLSINYSTFLDGWYADYRGTPIGPGWLHLRLPSATWLAGSRGALTMDAVLTFLGIGVLLAMVAVLRRRDAARPATRAAP